MSGSGCTDVGLGLDVVQAWAVAIPTCRPFTHSTHVYILVLAKWAPHKPSFHSFRRLHMYYHNMDLILRFFGMKLLQFNTVDSYEQNRDYIEKKGLKGKMNHMQAQAKGITQITHEKFI